MRNDTSKTNDWTPGVAGLTALMSSQLWYSLCAFGKAWAALLWLAFHAVSLACSAVICDTLMWKLGGFLACNCLIKLFLSAIASWCSI